MQESIREVLAREAEEAETAAEAQEAGGQPSPTGQRPAGASNSEASQVYSVRIPVERLEQLRQLAEERGVRPTALLREFVIDRLDRETAPVEVTEFPARDPNELRLGPPRSAPPGEVIALRRGRA